MGNTNASKVVKAELTCRLLGCEKTCSACSLLRCSCTISRSSWYTPTFGHSHVASEPKKGFSRRTKNSREFHRRKARRELNHAAALYAKKKILTVIAMGEEAKTLKRRGPRSYARSGATAGKSGQLGFGLKREQKKRKRRCKVRYILFLKTKKRFHGNNLCLKSSAYCSFFQ